MSSKHSGDDLTFLGLVLGSHIFCVYTVLCPPHCFVQILRRGMPPGGGGEVLFSCPVRKVLKPVQLTDPGKIKRIRGMAYPLPWILSLFLPRGVNNSTCFHYLHLRQQSHKSWGSGTMEWTKSNGGFWGGWNHSTLFCCEVLLLCPLGEDHFMHFS